MSRMSKARALVYHKYGDPLSVLNVEEVEVEKPKAGEVLVKFLASPINPADVIAIRGVYAIKPDLPAIGGNEGLAEVVRLGPSVTGLKEGDRVFPLKSMSGTWRTHAVFPVDILFPVTTDIPTPVAAMMVVNPCTAYRMLNDIVSLKAGDVVVQNGCTSAVGLYVIQMARLMQVHTVNVMRARPTPEATENVKKTLKDLGASLVLTEEEILTEDAHKAIAGLSSNVPLGFDCVGGESAFNLLQLLTPGGTLVTYGSMSGKPLQLPAWPFVFQDKQLRGFWVTGFNALKKNAEARREMYTTIMKYFVDKSIVPTPFEEVPFEHWNDAMERAVNRHVILSDLPKKQVLVFP